MWALANKRQDPNEEPASCTLHCSFTFIIEQWLVYSIFEKRLKTTQYERLLLLISLFFFPNDWSLLWVMLVIGNHPDRCMHTPLCFKSSTIDQQTIHWLDYDHLWLKCINYLQIHNSMNDKWHNYYETMFTKKTNLFCIDATIFFVLYWCNYWCNYLLNRLQFFPIIFTLVSIPCPLFQNSSHSGLYRHTFQHISKFSVALQNKMK